MNTVVVACLDGALRRVDLDSAENLGISTRENGGTKITGVWYQPRARRVIVGTYSIWESGRRDGTVVGQGYHEADANEIAGLAKEHGSEELLALVPVLADEAKEEVKG